MAAAPRKTGYVFEELYLWHDPGSIAFDPWTQPGQHWESASSKQRLHSLLCASGAEAQLTRIRARPASDAELLRFHTREYVDEVRALSSTRDVADTGDWARLSRGGFKIAALSAGGVLAGVEAVMRGDVDNAYCLVRPPGHHAEAGRGRGFCIFNNVVLGALHARATLGAKRVAVVDFDVHHGNGTEQAFRDDPDALFISIHQDRNYPIDSGEILEDSPTCINVPLPAGSGTGAYDKAFEYVVLPALERFKPDLLLVSAGFDASFMDPLGQMMLCSEAYRRMGQALVDAAGRLCGGKVVFCHEGGYAGEYVPFCGLAVVETLMGKRCEEVQDPWLEEARVRGYQACQPHQLAVVLAAAAAAGLPSVPSAEDMDAFEASIAAMRKHVAVASHP